MFKHAVDAHGGEVSKVKFRMRILKQHFTAMARQIHEGVAISRRSFSGVNIINSKMEGAYNRCKLPRLTIMGSEGEKAINIVGGEPAFEKDKEKVKTVANGNEMREKKNKAGSKVDSRQLVSQSSLQKYFHYKPTKHR